MAIAAGQVPLYLRLSTILEAHAIGFPSHLSA
jgi:hypothetical protein